MNPSFAELGLPPELVAALARDGINEPFAIQALTIADALAGKDICGKAKTGSGKTLAFGLPASTRVTKSDPTRPRGLVLVPTRELATQVTAALTPLGAAVDRKVRAVYGGVSMDPQVEALRKGVDIVVGTPGRLIDLIERGELSVADGRGARGRRSRPHGRHGLHAPGAEDPLPHRDAAPDDVVLGHARRRGRSDSSPAT